MIFRNRSQRSMPQLNTSSLPDLIFTVLFFFMVVTHMRKTTIKVEYRVPQGTELTRLVKKSAVSYIYIGKQPHSTHKTKTSQAMTASSDGYSMQLNDKLATPDDIADYIAAERQRMSPEDKQRQTVSLKADVGTHMSLVTDVKQALRKANVRKISYSAEQRK